MRVCFTSPPFRHTFLKSTLSRIACSLEAQTAELAVVVEEEKKRRHKAGMADLNKRNMDANFKVRASAIAMPARMRRRFMNGGQVDAFADPAHGTL